jgi:hypothetical protein
MHSINIYEINIFMNRPKQSLEDTIRAVRNKYKNSPSPLLFMNENIGYAPQQVTPNSPPSSKNIRNALVGDFKPEKYTF